jgi:hypothetical protein
MKQIGTLIVSALALATFAQAEPANKPGGSLRAVEQQGIQCEPREATRFDTIVIHLPTPHAGELAIEDPFGTRFLISFDWPSYPQPLLLPATFRSMTKLSIKISEAMGYSVGHGDQIFQHLGTYKVLVGKYLASDPVVEGWCRISLDSADDQVKCEPREVTPRDTLKIRLSMPHGPYLFIENSRRKRFYFAFPDAPDNRPPVVPDLIFRTTTELSIKVGGAKGYSFKTGAMEAIFQSPGTYTVEGGDGFESDGVISDGMCKIKFRR